MRFKYTCVQPFNLTMLNLASRTRSNRRRQVNPAPPVQPVQVPQPPPRQPDANPLSQLQNVMEKLLQKDTVPPPKVYRKGQSIAFHVRTVKRYMNATSVTRPAAMATTLLNSLEECIQEEVCAQSGYEEHADDFDWLDTTLKHMYQPPTSVVSPLLRFLNVRQKTGQDVTDYATELRVEAYRHSCLRRS